MYGQPIGTYYPQVQFFEAEANTVDIKTVTRDTKCRAKYPFSKKKRTACFERQDCIRRFADLGASNPNLGIIVEDRCNLNTNTELSDFCSVVGADVFFAKYGLSLCGTKTEIGEIAAQNRSDKIQNNKNNTAIAAGLGVVLLILILIFALSSGSKKGK